jgi:hypothetical protein
VNAGLSQGDRLRLTLTVALTVIFGMAWVWGWFISPTSQPNIAAAILVSGALWLTAALIGMWRPSSRHFSAALNSFAASAAIFAGLAALTGLHQAFAH